MPSRRLMPRDSSLAIRAYSLHRVGLTVGGSIGERGERQTALLDDEQQLMLGDVDAEPARRRELRDQTAVGDRRRVTDADRACDVVGGALERSEAIGDEA